VHSVNSLDELGYLSARLAKDTCEGKLEPAYTKRKTEEVVVEHVFFGQNPLSIVFFFLRLIF